MEEERVVNEMMVTGDGRVPALPSRARAVSSPVPGPFAAQPPSPSPTLSRPLSPGLNFGGWTKVSVLKPYPSISNFS